MTRLLVILAFLSLLGSCDARGIDGDNRRVLRTQSNVVADENAKRSAEFEIWQEIDGSVPQRGKTLYFRMFDDRSVEFQYILRTKNPSGPPNFIYSVESVAPAQISESEFARLRALVAKIDSSEQIGREYEGIALTLDVLTKLTIITDNDGVPEKTIVLNDADYDVTSDKYAKEFPTAVVDLIKETRAIRSTMSKGGSEQ